jgi:multisubunit Na+/H+ antiporter MnhC subunit
MRNTTPHQDQTVPIASRLHAAPLAAASLPNATLAPLPVATRLTALALAVATTSLVVGSQCGLAVMYVKQADELHAKAQPGTAATQLVAKAN